MNGEKYVMQIKCELGIFGNADITSISYATGKTFMKSENT